MNRSIVSAALLSLVALAGACDSKPATGGAASDQAAAESGTIVDGVAAPDVELTLHDGKKLKLSSLQGKLVLLYFYPKDDTPGCTVEAQGLRDNYEALQKAGVVIYGVSTQDAESHQAFIDKHDLPFALVVDDGSVAKAFEVPLTLGFASRHSFLVGKDGKLLKVWRKVDPKSHAGEVLETAQGAS